jgi:hypothetical protein
MDYINIYNKLIQHAKEHAEERRILNKQSIYFEGHHIIPKCLNGTGSSKEWKSSKYNVTKSNIVPLTAKEHYIAHLLLTKIYPDNPKIFYAFLAMIQWGTYNGSVNRPYRISSRQYQSIKELRKKHSHIQSRSNYSHSEETKQKLSESKKGNKWNKGRLVSDSTRELISKANTGKIRSNDFKLQMSILHKGKVLSEETRQKISNNGKGRRYSQPKVICPHCKKEGGKANMSRHHFEYCKYKP